MAEADKNIYMKLRHAAPSNAFAAELFNAWPKLEEEKVAFIETHSLKTILAKKMTPLAWKQLEAGGAMEAEPDTDTEDNSKALEVETVRFKADSEAQRKENEDLKQELAKLTAVSAAKRQNYEALEQENARLKAESAAWAYFPPSAHVLSLHVT